MVGLHMGSCSMLVMWSIYLAPHRCRHPYHIRWCYRSYYRHSCFRLHLRVSVLLDLGLNLLYVRFGCRPLSISFCVIISSISASISSDCTIFAIRAFLSVTFSSFRRISRRRRRFSFVLEEGFFLLLMWFLFLGCLFLAIDILRWVLIVFLFVLSSVFISGLL